MTIIVDDIGADTIEKMQKLLAGIPGGIDKAVKAALSRAAGHLTFLCLYGCRCREVSADLLCSRETIPESNGYCIGIRIYKLKRRSLEQREAKPSLIATEHSPPVLSRAPQARRSRLLLTAVECCAIPPACKYFFCRLVCCASFCVVFFSKISLLFPLEIYLQVCRFRHG